MKYLANILTEESFEENSFYNIVKDEKDLKPSIPTLIIGWERAKALHPEASILKWKIDENTYWTYGKRVRRDRNEADIKAFKKLVIERAIKSVEYWFFNVFTATKDEKLRLKIFLSDSRRKFALLNENMVYIYFPDDQTTIGISLNDIDYSGGDREKILNIIKKSPSITIIKERDYISYETRELIRNKKYIIPYLSSLSA